MRAFSLFSFSREFLLRWAAQYRLPRVDTLRLIFMTLVFGVITGCGGSVKQNNVVPFSGTIAFSSSQALDGSGNSIGAANIWLANADGSSASPVTRMTGGFDVEDLVWSPDGSKLAFISSRALDGSDAVNANLTFNLWVMNADGSGATPLTRLTSTSGQGVLDLAWSPDGRRIAFESNRALDGSDAVSANQRSNIWVVNSDGSGASPLTHLTAPDASLPVWSPDGSKIAFTSSGALDGSDAGGGFNIWVMKSDGSGLSPITRFTAASNTHATFSPDGTRLAFLSNRRLDGSDVAEVAVNIWMANADGSVSVPLTKYTAFDVGSIFSPFWSPDGKKVAFESTAALDGSDVLNTNSTRNVWVAKTDGSGATPLTHLAYSSPSFFGATPNGWSPDGASVASISDVALDDSTTHTFLNAWVVKADGSNSRALTNAGGTSPAWKP